MANKLAHVLLLGYMEGTPPMSRAKVPPLSEVLKAPEVEDPVNNYLHRPLAYGFVRLVHRTPLTPNGVTFLALLLGVAVAPLWLWGTPGAMVAGGVLLWAAAIIDGADGLLARAKGMQSQFGRALDGTADAGVAICSVIPAFLHMYWNQGEQLYHLILGPIVILLTLAHLYLYEFYKESYLWMGRLDRKGEGEDIEKVEQRLAAQAENTGLVTRFAVNVVLLPFQRAQRKLVARTNPGALRQWQQCKGTEETAQIYRKHNLGPMRLWTVISLCPHSYTMAICGMFDRIDIYFWLRLIGANVIMLIAILWQRRATAKTLQELSEVGVEPEPLAMAHS